MYCKVGRNVVLAEEDSEVTNSYHSRTEFSGYYGVRLAYHLYLKQICRVGFVCLCVFQVSE